MLCEHKLQRVHCSRKQREPVMTGLNITAYRLIVGEPVTWKQGIKKHCRDRDGSTHRRNAGAAVHCTCEHDRSWVAAEQTGAYGNVPGARVLTVQRACLLLRLPARLRQLVALIAVQEPVMGKGTPLARQSEPVGVGMYGACFRCLRDTLRNSLCVGKLAEGGVAGIPRFPRVLC